MEEKEEKEGEVDGEDSAALAGGGGGRERTQGQSESAGLQQKTDCGHNKLPRSKPHKKGDEKPQGDQQGIKDGRAGSDIGGGVLGSRGVHGFWGGLSEARSSPHARWTRDSPGILALSHHDLLPLDLDQNL